MIIGTQLFLRDAEVEKLAVKLHEPHKAPNAIQRETGYRDTAFTNQEIKFSKVLSKHIELVKSELRHLRIIFDEATKITALEIF